MSGEAAVLYVLYVLYVLPRCSSGTSQMCRGCRGYGKFGSLEVWRLGLEEPQRLKPGPPPLAALRPNAARHPQRHKGPQRSQSERLWRLGSLVHSLVRRAFMRAPASPAGPSLLFRRASWHVADVPGVQGLWEVWKLRGLEAWLFYPRPIRRPAGALSVHCFLFSGL